MSIRSLNIAPRAGLGFGVLALMVFALGGFALLQMANMRQQSDQVENNWLPSVMAVGSAEMKQRSVNGRVHGSVKARWDAK